MKMTPDQTATASLDMDVDLCRQRASSSPPGAHSPCRIAAILVLRHGDILLIVMMGGVRHAADARVQAAQDRLG
jgi:hypothetical protein